MPTSESSPGDRVALVTGATGRIGRCVARRLAGAGTALCLGYSRSTEAATALSEEIESEHGVPCTTRGFDVGDATAVAVAVREVAAWRGRLDILVGAHGVGYREFLRASRDDDIEAVVRLNTLGAVHCARSVVPQMTRNGFGRVIFIGSAAAGGRVRQAVYAASKSALLGLVRSAAREHAAQGVTFNLVSPGLIEGSPATAGASREKALAAYPMGRFIDPEEVAAAVAFLASAEARSITGHDLVLDAAERYP
jgi:3-oxoacyl-[acyl-carrier protein] reductase